MQNISHTSKDLKIISAQSSLGHIAEEILSIWELRVRKELKSATDILRPALMDALPKFLHLLGQALSEKKSRGLLEEGSRLVRKHAGERARDSSYNPTEIVKELQMLRETVTRHLEKELNLSNKDYATIQKTFDQAIQEALMEFFLVHAELKEKFTATLGHDLRAPLSSSMLSAQMILKNIGKISDNKAQGKVEDLTKKIVKDLKRIDGMIQDLLDESILQMGEKRHLEITKCDLFSIAQEVIHDLNANENGRINIIGSHTVGYWDSEGLRRAMENLIMNALKYGAKKEPITVKLSEKFGRVMLSVHNHGNPIAPHEKELIFSTFSRSRSAESSDHLGWGIGLSMVKAVSESLGGTVTVESNTNSGTTFTINIPVDARGFEKKSAP